MTKSNWNVSLLISLLALTCLLAWTGNAYARGPAQSEQPSGPVYIVQPGDTLTTIALQFGVTVDELRAANNLGQSDLIYVNDALVIPGLAGLTGVLETRTVPYGETLRSLSRAYQIPVEKLAQLNRLVSPAELFAGASLIVPVSAEAGAQPARSLLLPGQTMLELAVRAGANPWSLSQFNGLQNPARALPGDVLFIPGTASSGPGALPSSVTSLEVSDLYHGETAVIKIAAAGEAQFRGQLLEHEFPFFSEGDGLYVALQGIHTLTEPGLYPLTITGALPNGVQFAHSQMVLIQERGYIFESIVVPPALIDPETTNQEEEFVRPLFSQVTPERMWKDVFLAPSPFPDCITSTFGNRRSYNGSAFTYIHGGVDFCGGTGVEITAPAAGLVVFARPLEVRGNFTVIDHGWGVFSAYMHQSEILVEEGERVEPGQVIGLVGSTGRSTGPHLHWEIWVGGVQVNPLNWLTHPYP